MRNNFYEKAIKVLPNEQHNYYTISNPKTAFTSDLRIDLLDAAGKEVSWSISCSQLDSNSYRVDLEGLEEGVYHLRILDRETYFVKRIIVH